MALTTLIRTNLAELDLGLKGDLTMSEPMERLARHLAEGVAQASWRHRQEGVTELKVCMQAA